MSTPTDATPPTATPTKTAPTQTGPIQAAPAGTATAEPGPTQAGPAETATAEASPTQGGPTQGGPTQAAPAGAATAEAGPSQARPTGATTGGVVLAVVVPAFNEAASIGGTLAALAAQTDRDFRLIVVDNVSTDDTAGVVRRFAGTAPFPVEVISEAEPGAGTAADTGFRHAIATGATMLARTDADCLPAPEWVATLRAYLRNDVEMVCGRSVPRPDERPTWAELHVFPAAVRLAALYGRYRKDHRAPEFRSPYVLVHGHNLAITADLYQRCGGTAREALEDGSEDVTLLNRARRETSRIVRAEDVVVASSLRRLRAWGARRTLLWYWDRRWRPAMSTQVHVR